MKIEELLCIISDSAFVIVVHDGNEIARYDGRNSIPVDCNANTVLRLSTAIIDGKPYLVIEY